MASFRDRLKKEEEEQVEKKTFAERLGKTTQLSTPVAPKLNFPEVPTFGSITDKAAPIVQPRTELPSLKRRATLSPRASFAKETIVEDTKIKEQKKVEKEKIKVRDEQRKKTLKGANERLDILLEESKQIERSSEPNFKEQNRITKEILETRNIITANKGGFATGLRESIGLEPTAKFGAQLATPERQQAQEAAIEEARTQKGFTTGRVAGEITKQVTLYATVGKLLKGTQFITGLAKKFGGGKLATFTAEQFGDLLVDAVIQTPQEVLRGETIDKIGWNRLLDIGINLGIGAGGEYFKSLKRTDPESFEAALKQASPEQVKSIQSELGLPEGTTAKEFLEQQTKEFQSDEAEAFLKQFDKTPNDIFNDFQAWRSKNFGGATGRVSAEEMDTLKALYKEDTGIDLDVALKEVGGGITPLTKSQGELSLESARARTPELGERGDAITAPSRTFKQRLAEQEVKPVEPQAIKAIEPEVARVAPEVVAPKVEIAPKLAELPKVEAPKVEPKLSAKPVTPEIPKIETRAVKPVLTPSPRVPDIKTPEIGESKSPFLERISEFLKGDQTTAKLKQEIDNLDKLKTTTDEARSTMAKQIVKDDFEGALRLSLEGKQFGNRVESNISLLLADELQRQGRFAEQVELISKVSQKFRAAGQDVESAKAWAKTSPEGMKKWASDTLEKANVKVEPKLIAEIGDDMKTINEMTPQQLAEMVAKRLGKIGEKQAIQDQIINSFSFDQLKATNTALTMQKVFDKIPIVKAKKLSSLQAMSHLLNFRTFSRNILGNTASIAAENVNKIPTSIADRGLKAFTGNRSVVASMPKFLQGMQEGWKQGKRSFFEITSGVSKGNQGKYDLLFGSAFKGKTGKTLEKVMGISLQSTDEFYKGFVKVDSLYNQLQARIGKEVKKWDFEKVMTEATEEEVKTALDEAKFVTFQNDSALAGILSKTKKFANEVSAHIPGTVFTKDFGLGDLVVKYTRVPGNIITRGIEYSPVGYLRAVHDASKIITEGTNAPVAMQRQVAQALGRATTGSGLIAIGAHLRNKGIITGVDDTKDWDVNAFNNAEGVGNYRINIDALERYIKGGNPEKQEGDTLKSYNWAAPMTTSIAIGARLAAEDTSLFSVEGAKLLTAATMDEALDLPSLSIVKKMMFEGMKGDSETGNKMLDIMSVPIKEAIPSLVPSVVRQSAQAIDPTFRDTTAKSTIPVLPELVGDKAATRIQSALPFLSKDLPPRLDPLGREAKREGGPFGALVDPASTSTFKPTGFGDTLRKISELSGKTTVFPDRKPPKSFTFRGNVIKLTDEEKQLWQKTEGNYINERYSDFLKGRTVKDEADAVKFAKILETIKKRAGDRAKTTILKARR